MADIGYKEYQSLHVEYHIPGKNILYKGRPQPSFSLVFVVVVVVIIVIVVANDIVIIDLLFTSRF